MNNVITNQFYGIADPQKFSEGMRMVLEAVGQNPNIYASDNMFTFGRNMGFMTDPDFVKAIQDNNPADLELSFLWRTHTLAWAARHAIQLEGDFVECGCYRGYTAKVIADLVGFKEEPRQYWLYDVFNPATSMGSHKADIKDPFEYVKQRFSDFNNVNIIKGYVPDSFEQGTPDKIALLHIDMNHADAELAALDILFDRLVPGGIVVLDDYGWTAYKAQTVVEDGWLNTRNYYVLELPTGQGVVIKR